jgi:hypothetical protein
MMDQRQKCCRHLTLVPSMSGSLDETETQVTQAAKDLQVLVAELRPVVQDLADAGVDVQNLANAAKPVVQDAGPVFTDLKPIVHNLGKKLLFVGASIAAFHWWLAKKYSGRSRQSNPSKRLFHG